MVYAVYAVWFKGNQLQRFEDVTEKMDELLETEMDEETAANILCEELGASAVVAADNYGQAVEEAAEVLGIDEVDWGNIKPYWIFRREK